MTDNTNPLTGLTAAEAARRAQAGQSNRTTASAGATVGQILRRNLLTLFNLLNLVLALCVILVGEYRNALFMGVVISNTLIGTIQEVRAKRTVDRLMLVNTPECHVLRDGQEMTCAPEELVLGDLLILNAGDQVPADGVVVNGSGAADESLLTGESDRVTKKPGDELMSGSYLLEGKVIVELTRVGDDSYAAGITRQAKAIRRPKSMLMADMNRIISLVTRVLVPLGVLLFLKQFCLGHEPLNVSVRSAVAAMVGMIPEGLILLTSVALAVGVVTLGRRQTLVQELYGIETLARADVLCTDKTGTLTTGRMHLEKVIPADGVTEDDLRAAVSRYLGAMEHANATTAALLEAFPAAGEKPVATLPFSSARKHAAASFVDGTTVALGAPSFLMGRDWRDPVLSPVIGEQAAQGMRVLAVAQCRGCIADEHIPADPRLLGLLVLSDELRPNVQETVRFFREEDVTLKVISGDDPRTVSAVACRAGVPDADKAVDLSALPDDQVAEAAEKYTVFGRVTPQRKRILVEALKACGHSVAMTGDGVNDIPALKAADCSIAMAGGADAARHAAQLILLDSDFASLPAVVAEGRRVVGNISRASSLFLIKTFYSFALTVLTLLLPMAYPFQSVQLTLISALTIGAPGFVLALEPNRARISGSFLRRVMSAAIPGAAGVTVSALLAMALSTFGYIPAEASSSMAALSAAVMGLLSLGLVCIPFTRLRIAVVSVMSVAMVGAVALLGRLFAIDLSGMTAPLWLFTAGVTLLGAAVLLLLRWLIGKKGRAC